MTLQSAGLRKVSAITTATDANFLTTAPVSRSARAAYGGFRRARTTATTFHIFYRLQVPNFSLLQSPPNGVNYIDIRDLILHCHFFRSNLRFRMLD
jgi:hypothetical protein